MSEPSSTPVFRRWWECVLIVVVVLGAPALVRWGGLVKFPFDKEPGQALEHSRPRCVLIGDSMLRSRIEPTRLHEIADMRCDVLAYPGSGSAMWYLVMKNIVGELSNPPRWAIIFFRDRQLTLPAFRTEGRYRNGLEAFMPGPDPAFEQTLAAATHTQTDFVEHLLLTIYPLQKHRLEVRENLQEKALRLATNRKTKQVAWNRQAQIFDLKNLRTDRPPAETQESDEKERLNAGEKDFASAVDVSFLPMILKIAESRNIQLIFFRVKGHPRPGQKDTDHPDLQKYERDLSDYLREHGAIFIDESRDPDVTEEFYATDDHVNDRMIRPYTEMFWRKMRPHLDAAPSAPSSPAAP